MLKCVLFQKNTFSLLFATHLSLTNELQNIFSGCTLIIPSSKELKNFITFEFL